MQNTGTVQFTDEQLQQAIESIKKLTDAIIEAIKPIIEAFKRWAKTIWDKLMEAAARDINPKWWHYYKHSKRKRTRKKYRTRIRNHLMELLTEGERP